MAKRTNDFLSLKDALQQMLQENKLQKGIDQITVQDAWKKVMGKGVTSYTNKVELKKCIDNKTIICYVKRGVKLWSRKDYSYDERELTKNYYKKGKTTIKEI